MQANHEALSGLIGQARRLIDDSIGESDAAVEDLLGAIEGFYRDDQDDRHAAAQKVVVAMQFYDILCQRLRQVQACLDECQRHLPSAAAMPVPTPADDAAGTAIRTGPPSHDMEIF